MKWQKNTGVMPCEGNAYVELRFGDGSSYIGKAGYQDWSLERIDKITHWCYVQRTPFDYVEPKVWTVDFEDEYTCRVEKKGVLIYTLARSTGSDAAIDYLIDALNAWEERNGLH